MRAPLEGRAWRRGALGATILLVAAAVHADAPTPTPTPVAGASPQTTAVHADAPTPTPTPVAGASPQATAVPDIFLHKLPGLPGRAAAMLVSGPRGGELRLAALAVPESVGLGNLNLAVIVDVDTAGLLPDPPVGSRRYLLGVYALTTEPKVVATAVYGFRLDAAALAPALTNRGIKIILPLGVPRETVIVRVLLRDEAGAFGLVEAPPLVVLTNMLQDFSAGAQITTGATSDVTTGLSPSAASSAAVGATGSIRSSANRETGPFLTPPVLLEPAQNWLRAVLPSGVREPNLPLPDQPGMVPATLKVLHPGQETTMWALSSGMPREATAIRVRLGNRDGQEIKVMDLPISTRRPAGIGMERLEMSLTLPNLEPDIYSFELLSTGIAAGMGFLGDEPFLVAEPNPDAPAMSWVQATAAPPVSAAQRAAELARQAEEESTPAVREGYHAALTLLPSKGYGAVVDAIRTLEGDALVKGSSFELDKVLRAELVVARRVTGKDPKGLLLLIRIHSELLVEYDRAKLYIQAAHARRMIEGLAAMLADTGPAAKPQAAEVMAALGSRFQHQGLHVSAERLIRHALEIEDTNASALLGLAAGLERAGNYRLAATTLSTLVKAHPDHPEGRLRLAINLVRTNRSSAAREHFQRCTAESSPPWVRALAYQEQARALLDDGKLGQATSLLQEATQAVPADFHLKVQLVAALDRQHRFLDASRLVDELRRRDLSREPSARLRYAEWPPLEVEDTLRELHAMEPDTILAMKARILEDNPEVAQ